MSIENLYPYAGNHAVQSVFFALEWAEPLNQSDLLGVKKLAAKFANAGLLEHREQASIALNLEAHSVSKRHANAQPEVSGHMFARAFGLDTSSRSVTIDKQNCLISIPDYTRWEQVFDDVQGYLKIALNEIAPKRGINVVGLQYIDIFSWKDDPSEINLREIFSDGGYMPPNVFEQNGLWHLHHGFLEDHSVPLPHKLLENINVDMQDVGGERTIRIVGSHRANLEMVMWQSHMKNKHALDEMFISLHEANKAMLKKLLEPAVCSKIKLNSD